MNFNLMTVCETCIIDRRTDLMSLIKIIEEINSVAFPVYIGNITAVVMLSRTPDEPSNVQASLVVSLNDQHLSTTALQMDFEGKLYHRHIVAFDGTVIPQPGTLKFAVNYDGDEKISWTVPIRAVAQPAAAQ